VREVFWFRALLLLGFGMVSTPSGKASAARGDRCIDAVVVTVVAGNLSWFHMGSIGRRS
jgi:hypothetical protein